MGRLRFLGIYSNNLDEFIKVRVGNLIRYNSYKGKEQMIMTGGYSSALLLPMINQQVAISQEVFQKTYSDILNELEGHGVHMVNEKELSESQLEYCREYFMSVVSVRVVPMLIRKNFDIPFLPDGKIYLAVKMASQKTNRYAILKMPVSAACPRFVVLPTDVPGRTDIIFLDDIIRLFLDDIFFMFNYDTISVHTFKIVRDAELNLDDDVSKSLSEKMFKGLSQRDKGRPIRMVFDKEMPADVLDTISKKLGFKSMEQLDAGGRYHLMRDLMKFPKVRPQLENSNPRPMLHKDINPFDSILKVIKNKDILLCYPYHTFNHIIDMLREAAVDPRVHSIYIALYRTADNSKIISALRSAVKNGKNVTALVELKARFDEMHNIDSTDTLQSGGVKVIHSPEELKVHSKLILIERFEGQKSRGYVHVGTGNFNENTATLYSDFGLLTSDPKIADDARKVFDFLQHSHRHYTYDKLMVAPHTMRSDIETIIHKEIEYAKKGGKAYFYGKFNSLTDKKMIDLLYKASNAGVKIRLLVRGACCLIAQKKGLSKNIEVRSIIDKYLEHARMIICSGGGKPHGYIMSADLMTRNLDRRVEVGVPIADKRILVTLKDYFSIQWSDNVKSRDIAPPYNNDYIANDIGKDIIRSQEALYKYFSNNE